MYGEEPRDLNSGARWEDEPRDARSKADEEDAYETNRPRMTPDNEDRYEE